MVHQVETDATMKEWKYLTSEALAFLNKKGIHSCLVNGRYRRRFSHYGVACNRFEI
jgi:hypothetical protein